jgi:Arc/MetJ-type ribon-helix-helix transcriptional regulator
MFLPRSRSDGINKGMRAMTHRTTFALDETTAQRLRILAARWRVSQAEVVRRSVEQAEKADAPARPNPVEMLRQLHERGGGLDPAKADAYLAEVYEDRKRWRGE